MRKALKAATLRLSVNSRVVFKSTPFSFSDFNPSTNSGNVLTGLPNVFASFPLLSARFRKILRVAVAAIEASKPASDNLPNKAKVSSILKLKAFATGPTIGNAVARYENDNALLVVATAIADTYLSVSLVSALNIRREAPANEAASANSAPVACANFRTCSVASNISFRVKPSLASSICKSVASDAVYFVVAPKR